MTCTVYEIRDTQYSWGFTLIEEVSVGLRTLNAGVVDDEAKSFIRNS